jgi:hypothetical protein
MRAMTRLLGRGLEQRHVVPENDATVWRSGDTVSTPSSRRSRVDDSGERQPRNTSGTPAADSPIRQGASKPQTPSELGTTRLNVQLDDTLAEHAVRELLASCGATDIDRRTDAFPEENPGVWPEPSEGSATDVARAVAAAERGAAGDASADRAPGEGPSLKEAHDPHR